MATQHPHAAAQTLAGEVFGKILNREADPGGYAYVLDCLESGQKSLQQIVIEFMTSDEFIERFALSLVPAQTVRLLHRLLLGSSPEDDEELQPSLREFVRLGLKAYVENIAGSADYADLVGPDRVPGCGHGEAYGDDDSEQEPPEQQLRPGRLHPARAAAQAEQENPAHG